MTGLEYMNGYATGKIPPPPVVELVGMKMTDASPGEATFVLDVDEKYSNPMGTLHGGILCDLGDAAMGCAVATTLDEGQSYTTLELQIHFFKPVWSGRLTAKGTVVRRTRKLVYAEAEVVDEKGSLVAKLNSNCLVLLGDEAQGR
jgi:uncharacterized protein (TIGR00369 family)